MSNLELTVALSTLIIILLVLYFRTLLKVREFKKKYGKIINIETEVEQREKQLKKQDEELSELKANYKAKRDIYENLLKELSFMAINTNIQSLTSHTNCRFIVSPTASAQLVKPAHKGYNFPHPNF